MSRKPRLKGVQTSADIAVTIVEHSSLLLLKRYEDRGLNRSDAIARIVHEKAKEWLNAIAKANSKADAILPPVQAEMDLGPEATVGSTQDLGKLKPGGIGPNTKDMDL